MAYVLCSTPFPLVALDVQRWCVGEERLSTLERTEKEIQAAEPLQRIIITKALGKGLIGVVKYVV